MPIGGTAIMLALVASIGGFIFGYDTGQISDILLMEDFKLRFATCSNPTDHTTCEFSTVRAGLIVSLLSIGTLAGALMGAPYVSFENFCFCKTHACGSESRMELDGGMPWFANVAYSVSESSSSFALPMSGNKSQWAV